MAITRAQLGSTISTSAGGSEPGYPEDVLIVSGTNVAGDSGAGDIYSKIGATSSGLMAVRNASGVWYQKIGTVSGLGVSGGPPLMTRAAALIATGLPVSFITSGFTVDGDYGAGAVYTSQGAGSSGPMAFQNNGVWYQLITRVETNAGHWGAVGNGVADDTTALQNFLNYCVTNAVNGYIPNGMYKTTAALTMGYDYLSAGPNVQGITIRGGGVCDTPAPGYYVGTAIVYFGAVASANAVLQVNSSCYRFLQFSDFIVYSNTQFGATYGLVFWDTQFSQHTVRRVHSYNASIAFAVVLVNITNGQDGEFVLFEDCRGLNVNKFFYTNAGQAYVQNFIHCRGGVLFGGITFHLAGTAGGGGLNIFDFNGGGSFHTGSGEGASAIGNSTFVQNDGAQSCLNVIGGRLEQVTCIYSFTGTSTNIGGTVLFQGMEIGTDFDPLNNALTLPAVVKAVNNEDNLLFHSCSFFVSNPNLANCTFPILIDGGWGDIRFRNCDWEGYETPPFIKTSTNLLAGQVDFEQCRADAAYNQVNSASRMTSFDRHFAFQPRAIGKRSAYSENAYAPSGRPSNLLVKPEISTVTGTGTRAPDSPWVAAGAASVINSYSWNDTTLSGYQPASSSQWAREVRIAASSSLYQDIAALPLNSTNNYPMNGQNMTLVTFQGLFTQIFGRGNISLIDSVSGKIYDQFVMNAFSGAVVNTPFVITLTAMIEQTGSLSYPRLIFNNAESGNIFAFAFRYMFVSGRLDAMFTPAAVSTEFVDDFSIGAEKGIFWDRLRIPLKSDTFGSAPTNALPDLGSDIYQSTTDNRLTYYANSAWWKLPRTTIGTVVPAAGTWALGDRVQNSSPAVGSPKGWVCTVAGTPGTWVSEGNL